MDEDVAGDEGLEPEPLAQPVRLRRRRAPWNASGPIVRIFALLQFIWMAPRLYVAEAEGARGR